MKFIEACLVLFLATEFVHGKSLIPKKYLDVGKDLLDNAGVDSDQIDLVTGIINDKADRLAENENFMNVKQQVKEATKDFDYDIDDYKEVANGYVEELQGTRKAPKEKRTNKENKNEK